METVLSKRKSHHLQGYDYGRNGAYFVTICTHQRRMLFGPNQAPVGADSISARMAARVFRNETDYRMIAEYIQSNPQLWHKDCFYEEPPHEP